MTFSFAYLLIVGLCMLFTSAVMTFWFARACWEGIQYRDWVEAVARGLQTLCVLVFVAFSLAIIGGAFGLFPIS